ncbi:MAG: hypothetical protein QF473_23925 [Planctomycetota bacterium]|jgi:hypothetical protein|nr:hypothetical protein [Planctomycetota bacterium]
MPFLLTQKLPGISSRGGRAMGMPHNRRMTTGSAVNVFVLLGMQILKDERVLIVKGQQPSAAPDCKHFVSVGIAYEQNAVDAERPVVPQLHDAADHA